MTLHGIDISNYQAGLKLANTDAQFAIMRATEGSTLVDAYCDGFVSQAKKLGLPWGVYHFARGNGETEAKWFLKNVGDYIGQGVLVLDWEDSSVSAGQAKAFLDYVKQQTGITPWLYTMKNYLSGASAIEKAGYPLWIAWPSSASSYGSVSPWSKAIMWQHTWEHSTGGMKVDGDYFYGTTADWQTMATGNKTPDPSGGGDTTTEDVWPTLDKIRTPYGTKGSSWASGYHQGDDWHRNAGAAEIGDPIYAVASGKIIYAGDARQTDAGWGSAFGIHVLNTWDEHGRTSIDAHMSKLHVKTGDRVQVGDLIGEKGGTGNVSGPHDHHEQHTGPKWTDPDVKPIYPGKKVPTPATTDQEDFDVATQGDTQTRTDNQTVPPDKEYHELKLENNGDLSFGFGGGRYKILARFILSNLTPAEELLVRAKRFDTDANTDERIKDSDTAYWVVGLTGGGGKSYRDFQWEWHVPAPPKGHGRRLRLEAANFTGHDIVIEDIHSVTWKAPL